MGSEWRLLRIADVGRVVTGKTPLTSNEENFGVDYPFITIPDLGQGRYIKNTARYVSEKGAQLLRSCQLPAKSVLMSCIATIGKTGITTRPSFTNQQINSVICGPEVVPEYIYYVFSQLKEEVEAAGGGGSVYTNVSKSRFSDIRIPIPPLAVQHAIAQCLGALDDRITLLRETNATLEAIAQALFKSWFVDFDPVHANIAAKNQPEGAVQGSTSAAQGRVSAAALDAATAALFPDSFEESELGLVPRGWRIGCLADLVDFQNGYAFKSKDWVATGHPVVKIGDVKPGIIDLQGCSFVSPETTTGLDRFKLDRGSLLVGMTGYVGETGLVPTVSPSAYLNQRVGRFSTKRGLADLGLVYCLVRDQAFKTFAEAQSHGSAQANVSGAALLSYSAIMPSSEVHDVFNGIMASLLESILSNHEKAQTLTQLRDTLLPRLISGQLRLPDVEAALRNTDVS